jgi:hypothetical protein
MKQEAIDLDLRCCVVEPKFKNHAFREELSLLTGKCPVPLLAGYAGAGGFTLTCVNHLKYPED